MKRKFECETIDPRGFAVGLESVLTKKKYDFDYAYTVVEKYKGKDIESNLGVLYDTDNVKKHLKRHGWATNLPGMFRFMPLLPLNGDLELPMLLIGDTPLYRIHHQKTVKGMPNIFIKDEGRNPTGSMKDRASAMVITAAMAQGINLVATASTGNAAAALCGISASMPGSSAVIFVPKNIPQAKLTQLLVYGAKVFLVDGTYDDAFDLCMEASHKYIWYNRSTGYNYLTVEGKKTVSFEIAEQMSDQYNIKNIDAVFISVGDGNCVGGVIKGFEELVSLERIKKMPRIYGIQAELSNACYTCWKNNDDPALLQPIKCSTIADSISAGLPRDPVRAINGVKNSGGEFILVSDNEIIAAIPDLAQRTGVFAEPAASAAWAGFLKAVDQNLVKTTDNVVIISTGNGLKDINSAQKSLPKSVGILHKVKNIEDVDKCLGNKS